MCSEARTPQKPALVVVAPLGETQLLSKPTAEWSAVTFHLRLQLKR